MPDYTDADVARLAEMMGYWHTGNLGMARHLLDQGVTLPPPPPDDTPPENDLVGWAITIISNVDAPEVGWPSQTDEWRTAARGWLDSIHPPPDPAFVVAAAIRFAYLGSEDLPMDEQWPGHARMVAAVRDLFTPEALVEAAAKVQEAVRGE